MATSAATCGYCSELFTDPRMLPCLHTFCLPCLAKASEIQGAKEALQCPSCDEKAPLRDGGVHTFPKHLRKEHEVDVARYRSKFDSEAGVECTRCLRKNAGSAVAFCTNCCEFLCKLCREDHLPQGNHFADGGLVGYRGHKNVGLYWINVIVSELLQQMCRSLCQSFLSGQLLRWSVGLSLQDHVRCM